jgi:hypothetical protein
MRNHFTKDYLELSVERRDENKLVLHITSETGMCHKSQLYVNEKRLADDLERFWKSIKTKKLLRMSTYFGEVDWYDDEVDVYETPVVSIQRGLKRARMGFSTHGSIPKDWTFTLTSVFADTSANTPIMEVIKAALGSYFTPQIEKEFVKKLRLVLQKKTKYANYQGEGEDDDY